MFRRSCLILSVTAVIFLCCASPATEQQPVIVEKSHPVYITGTVKTIERTDVDKSGKNPRFMVHFVVKIETYDAGGWETILDPEVTFVCRESELLKQTGLELKAGAKVYITAHIIEKSPKVIAVYNIRILRQEE